MRATAFNLIQTCAF